MRFDIRLVHEIYAVHIAKIIPIIVLRIMRIAHTITIRPLELLDILLVTALWNIMTEHRIALVSIRALQFNRLAIEIIAPVLNLADSKTEDGGNILASIADHDLVTVRLFRAPKLWRIYDNRLVVRSLDEMFL